MNKLFYIAENEFHDLKSNICNNLNLYDTKNNWIEDYFISNDGWKIDTNVNFKYQELIASKSALDDLENAKRIFCALKDLTVVQATDERVWAYLTHTIYRDYMMYRWDVSKQETNKEEYIKSRYFFSRKEGNPFIRNGLSRLWWTAYSTYDETRENPFELTEYLMSSFSLSWNFLTRNFSQNTSLLRNILSALIELNWLPQNVGDISKLVKYINQVGGITILDVLSKEEVKKILENHIKS